MSSEVMETQMRACMFVRACVVCEQKGACFASSKSMSPRGNVEPETKSKSNSKRKKDGVWEREREEALGKQILLSSPSSNLRFFTRRLKHLGENILLEEISEDGELKL